MPEARLILWGLTYEHACDEAEGFSWALFPLAAAR
jgi:hypothetical protein